MAEGCRDVSRSVLKRRCSETVCWRAAVFLIQALGGGWDIRDLPTEQATTER